MTFKHYLEEEDDKPYFTTNSLGYYYDKMEGFAKAVEGSAKALNLTKEEVEKRLTLYIEQNKNELDQRLAQWDGKLETFDSSVETLLTEWVDDGTLITIIDSTLIDQKIAPVTALLAGKANYRQTGTGSSVSMIAGYEGNAIASDLTSGTIAGGGKVGAENVIGGNLANVGTNNPNNDVMEIGTDAQLAVIGGGYDNVVNGKAGVVTSFHSRIYTGATHGTISGGSYHDILSGDYNAIGGGTKNKINQSYVTISGGSGNEGNGNGSTVGGGLGNKAQGQNTAVAGGFGNIVDGKDSTIAGGYGNIISALASTIAGGYQQLVSGTYSFLGGGFKNTASGTYSSVVGGRENEAGSPYSTVIGREGKSTIEGEFVQAQGKFAAVGDSQLSQIPIRRQTTNATTAVLGAGTGTASLNVPIDSTWGFKATIVARRSDVDGETAMWEVKGLAQRGASGSTSLVGTPTITEVGKSAGALWTVGVRTSGFALIFDVTGENGKLINWLGKLEVVQITG